MNIRKFNDYENKYKTFINTLNIAFIDEEETEETLTSIYINFYLKILKDFGEYNKEDVLKFKFDYIEYYNRENYKYLDRSFVNLIFNIDITNTQEAYNNIQNKMFDYLTQHKKEICNADTLSIEKSDYSQKLYSLHNPTFNDIKKISVEYINNIDNQQELFTELDRGRYIIDKEELLYQYIFSYSTMHKTKLYDSFNIITKKLKNTSINIIDWGCGQAIASSLFIEYIKENNIDIDIENILLVEPSKLALSRGALHIDILKQKKYNINMINKDLDCLDHRDIKIDSNNLVLHLFSNILDAEFFTLDTLFLEKISNSISSDNYFICISPNISKKRNGRIEQFYKYFNDKFNAEIISSRDTNIGNCTRFEKIFQVKYTKQEEVIKSRQKIQTQSNNYLNIYNELKSYKEQIFPILDLDKLEENIEKDPEYLIFKTRKVAEVITSKIYSKYESNSKNISFNDMIRYLSFEKRLFNKKVTSNLHTIRTIGNINVHEHDLKLEEQKLDAHLMLISLLILLKELEDKKLF